MPLRVIHGRTITFMPPTLGGMRLKVPQIFQEQTNWCWAACAQMVFEYYGIYIGQCDLANWLFGLQTCCSTGSSDECNKTCTGELISVIYRDWGLQSDRIRDQVEFQVLQFEINAGRPVEVGFGNVDVGFSKHLAIVSGWDQDSIGPLVILNDPGFGYVMVSYPDLLTPFGYGHWESTWVNIRG